MTKREFVFRASSDDGVIRFSRALGEPFPAQPGQEYITVNKEYADALEVENEHHKQALRNIAVAKGCENYWVILGGKLMDMARIALGWHADSAREAQSSEESSEK